MLSDRFGVTTDKIKVRTIELFEFPAKQIILETLACVCACSCVRVCVHVCVFAYACVLASVHEKSVSLQNVLSMQKKKKKLDRACSSVMPLLQGMGGKLIKPAYEHLTLAMVEMYSYLKLESLFLCSLAKFFHLMALD